MNNKVFDTITSYKNIYAQVTHYIFPNQHMVE